MSSHDMHLARGGFVMLRDTHRLACLGLPEDKIHLWPCPDPSTCTLERCPESLFTNV